MSWEQTTVRKLRAGPPPSLGQAAKSTRTDKLKRLSQAERKAHLAQHGSCVDHVEVAGLEHPVCITRGADPERLIAEARDLSGPGR
jgi:hypothetical protein